MNIDLLSAPSLYLDQKNAFECKPSSQLPPDFHLTELDVFCGRGKQARVHVGTKHFRGCIKDNLPRYLKANSKEEKSCIVKSIVNFVRYQAVSIGGAGFVKYDNRHQCWIEIGDCHAREKVGHALRDISKQKSRLNYADSKKFSYVPTITTTAQVSPVSTITQTPLLSVLSTAASKIENHDEPARQYLFRTQRNLFLSYINNADVGKWDEHESQAKKILDYYDGQNYGV